MPNTVTHLVYSHHHHDHAGAASIFDGDVVRGGHGHDTLMFIDVVNAGWVPIYNLNLSEDVPGYMAAPAIALSYPLTHLICGHLGRLATRDDVAVHQAYIADIEASAKQALAPRRHGDGRWRLALSCLVWRPVRFPYPEPCPR
jgi:hypothetical protein